MKLVDAVDLNRNNYVNYEYDRPSQQPKRWHQEDMDYPPMQNLNKQNQKKSSWNEGYTRHLLSKEKLLFLLILLPVVMGVAFASILEPQIWLMGQPSNRNAMCVCTHTNLGK